MNQNKCGPVKMFWIVPLVTNKDATHGRTSNSLKQKKLQADLQGEKCNDDWVETAF